MNIEQIYKDANAYLEGHFRLSSGNFSKHYLQSAKVLENPKTAQLLAELLAKQITDANIKVDTVCSPALGGVLAGYELARALGVRFIFTERVEKVMTLRRGFEVSKDENIIICEDIITTGGSALESAKCVKELGANITAYAALANRGFCKRVGSSIDAKCECKLPNDVPFFALEDFDFKMYTPDECDFKDIAYKPGSRGN